MVSDVGLNAVEIAVTTLLTDPSITALVPAADHWNSVPPPSADYPVITYQYMFSDRRSEGFDGKAESFVYLIKAITKGEHSIAEAGAIADAIDQVFEGGTLTATGWLNYSIRRELHLRFIEYSEERIPFAYAGARYRFWMERP